MYCGENCLTLEKGGDSIRALQESKKCKSEFIFVVLEADELN
jgi:hypothetical protein